MPCTLPPAHCVPRALRPMWLRAFLGMRSVCYPPSASWPCPFRTLPALRAARLAACSPHRVELCRANRNLCVRSDAATMLAATGVCVLYACCRTHVRLALPRSRHLDAHLAIISVTRPTAASSSSWCSLLQHTTRPRLLGVMVICRYLFVLHVACSNRALGNFRLAFFFTCCMLPLHSVYFRFPSASARSLHDFRIHLHPDPHSHSHSMLLPSFPFPVLFLTGTHFVK
ncbi:hypothetical protein C8R45DRAFT_187383 [Mycena sanguinolenta]|nr:hypothetical protein C8R45DRAFT_187383 [Mycena sanguinolenta]